MYLFVTSFLRSGKLSAAKPSTVYSCWLSICEPKDPWKPSWICCEQLALCPLVKSPGSASALAGFAVQRWIPQLVWTAEVIYGEPAYTKQNCSLIKTYLSSAMQILNAKLAEPTHSKDVLAGARIVWGCKWGMVCGGIEDLFFFFFKHSEKARKKKSGLQAWKSWLRLTSL